MKKKIKKYWKIGSRTKEYCGTCGKFTPQTFRTKQIESKNQLVYHCLICNDEYYIL